MLNSLFIFLKKVESKFKRKLINIIGYPVLYNVNNSSDLTHKKRALLIYLVTPFLMRNDDPIFLRHQNFKQCKQIAAILGEFGYVVDVADVKDERFKSSKNYDLIISHRVNLNGRDAYLKKDALKIYLSAGMNHIVHNQNIQKRYNDLLKRRNCKINFPTLHPEEMPFVKAADVIIGLGNEITRDSWKLTFKGPIYSFNNYANIINNIDFTTKDFHHSRNKFLFFASAPQIRKGLDLLLEIFPKHPELHLYICSPFKYEVDFCRCYKKELYETHNIHLIGWVGIDSMEYYDLINKCAYAILPSCEEACVGSVVQCMGHGLIPIVTKEAGIDTDDFGITLNDDSLDEIEQTIVNLSGKPIDWLIKHSMKTKEVAETLFSEEAFVQRWREILGLILGKGPENNTVR